MYRLVLFFLCALIASTCAQFSFFDNIFRQQHQEQHHAGAAQWASHIDSIPCSQYLCKTLECVKSPAQCPCPDVEDVRCVIPDSDDRDSGTVICVRGKNECDQVERLAKKTWK
ncbi:long chronological lifespan protein 2 [Moniliophthora roreri MCA 2997]|uniref:Long chronological lifespan protein 2 n=1 Tax=Moniliophthora roreri (strain MCA 2997) TaxID=1381753 RepID=V2YS12_MONRO|nr:long chronological lifespan protein 2 [Moniliophthora roreri MCA 2997]